MCESVALRRRVIHWRHHDPPVAAPAARGDFRASGTLTPRDRPSLSTMLKCGAQDDRADQPGTPADRPGYRRLPGTRRPLPTRVGAFRALWYTRSPSRQTRHRALRPTQTPDASQRCTLRGSYTKSPHDDRRTGMVIVGAFFRARGQPAALTRPQPSTCRG